MHVARLQPEPVHRRQMPDRIGRDGVQHQLRLRRRAGGEIQQQRIVGARSAPSGDELRRRRPAGRRSDASRRPDRRRRCASDRLSSPANLRGLRDGGRPHAAPAPRSNRSARSSAVSSVVAGITTAPSFIAASMTSHSGTTLPSISRMRSPRLTPSARSPLATRLERSDSSAKVSSAGAVADDDQRRAGRQWRRVPVRHRTSPAPS